MPKAKVTTHIIAQDQPRTISLKRRGQRTPARPQHTADPARDRPIQIESPDTTHLVLYRVVLLLLYTYFAGSIR